MKSDHIFLQRSIEILETLRQRTVEQGYPMLASLLDVAKTEAEDSLKTEEQSDALRTRFFSGEEERVAPKVRAANG